MREHHYETLNETLHTYEIKDRLKVYHVHKPDSAKTFVSATVPLGSVHEGYRDHDGTIHHVPRGVAHFLEHAMFKRNGEDLSKAFAREEASINAFTDHHATTYLFSATAGVAAHTERLLQMLLFPELNAETVEKEKQIITEELNMHNDDPFYLQYRGLMNNLYATHPLKDDILGTASSIGSMTPEDLMAMHEAYYDPVRMHVVVVGNIAPSTLHAHLEKCVSFPGFSKKTPLEIRKENVRTVNSAYERRSFDIMTPSLMMGLKLGPEIYASKEPIKRFLTYSIAIEALLGSTSQRYESFLENKLVNDAYDIDVVFEPSYANILLFAETDYPEDLREALLKVITEEAPRALPMEDFLRVKRSMLGQFIRVFDSSERLAGEIADHLQFNLLYHDLFTILESVTKEAVDSALKDLDPSSISTFAALPSRHHK